MFEVVRDWNYAPAVICGESAFILRERRARKFIFDESAFTPALALTRRHAGAQTRITSSELLDEQRAEHTSTRCSDSTSGRTTGGQNVSQRSESSSSPIGAVERGDFFVSNDGCPCGTTCVAGHEHDLRAARGSDRHGLPRIAGRCAAEQARVQPDHRVGVRRGHRQIPGPERGRVAAAPARHIDRSFQRSGHQGPHPRPGSERHAAQRRYFPERPGALYAGRRQRSRNRFARRHPVRAARRHRCLQIAERLAERERSRRRHQPEDAQPVRPDRHDAGRQRALRR